MKSGEFRRAFIARETWLLSVPHVPEIELHMAHEAIDLWQKTEEELAEMGLPPPFWAFARAGGQALARHVIDHPEQVKGRVVLDFASGSGLAGIAAANAGAASVIASDIDPFAIEAMMLNARANSVSLMPTDQDLTGATGTWDVILAGDILYEQGLAARVMTWLEAEHACGVIVLIGDPGQAYLPRDRLECPATYRVWTVGALKDHEVKCASVWRFAQVQKNVSFRPNP